MALRVNLRQLERQDLKLQGELTAEELDLVTLDELFRLAKPLAYDLVAQKIEDGVLVRGELVATLACECSRCLKPFEKAIIFEDWACHMALEGEEAVAIKDDSVDLTPYLREDILLELPQRPLCKPDCGGLPQTPGGEQKPDSQQDDQKASAWDELNKLKF